MEAKFIIFVLVASLVQSSFVQPLNSTYGLTEDEVVGLNQIVIKQNAALLLKSEGITQLFDSIKGSADSLIYKVGARGGLGDVTTISKARFSAKRGFDLSLDAMRIVVGEDCSAVEEARRAMHANIERVYEAAAAGILLSEAGKSSAEQRRVVLEEYGNLVRNFYNPARICLDIKDAYKLGVVQQAEDGSRVALTHVTNALFNAMDVNAAAISAGKANVILIYTIESSQQQASDAVRADIESAFGAIKGFYTYSKLNQANILPGLASNQFALTVASYNFEAMADAMYGTILNRLDGVALGLRYAGRPYFTSDDAGQAVALASVIAGCNSLFDYIYTVHSNDTSAASAAKAQLADIAQNVIGAIWDGIGVAGAAGTTDNSNWLPKILALREITLSYFVPASDAFFNAMRNGRTLDTDREMEFSALQEAGSEILMMSPYHIFDAIIVLAKAVVANSASPSDFSQVVNDKAGSYSALDLFTQYVSAGGVVLLGADLEN